MRVLMCGSRTWDDKWIMPAFVRGLAQCGHDELILVHGAASGADSMAAAWWSIEEIGPIDPYPADWDKHGKAAGPIRNQEMLDEGKPDVVIAFVDKRLEASRGTNDMVTRAKKAGILTYVVEKVT